MLRWTFFALIALNLGYFLWSGEGSQATSGQREPQRLGQQVRPEMLQIRKGDAAAPPGAGPLPAAPAAAPAAASASASAPATDDSTAR